MAFSASAQIDIEARREVVWQVLVDVERWSEWSTWLAIEDGRFTVGERVRIRLTPPDGEGWSFSPEVLVMDAPTLLTWVGRTGPPGIFDGEHRFRLEALPDGRTRLHNEERYSGLLTPVMRWLPQMRGLDAGFAAMNEEIRKRAETLAAGTRPD